MQFRDERERLIAEQAVLAYRAVQEAAEKAEYGHGFEVMEEAALAGCRETGKRMLTLAIQARANAEKSGGG